MEALDLLYIQTRSDAINLVRTDVGRTPKKAEAAKQPGCRKRKAQSAAKKAAGREEWKGITAGPVQECMPWYDPFKKEKQGRLNINYKCILLPRSLRCNSTHSRWYRWLGDSHSDCCVSSLLCVICESALISWVVCAYKRNFFHGNIVM